MNRTFWIIGVLAFLLMIPAIAWPANGGVGGLPIRSFVNIAAGGETVSADRPIDILTITAGTGVSIAASPTADSLTISAPASSAVSATTGTFDALNLTGVCSTDQYHLMWNSDNSISCDDDDTGGGGGNAFTTIDFAAGTDAVADSSTDTLVLAAGQGITISGTDPDTGTIAWDGLLDELGNPDGNTAFSMGNNLLKFTYNGPTGADGAFEIEASGGFSGDLLHVHQHTGNPSSVDLIHAEADDADVVVARLTAANASATALSITGVVSGGELKPATVLADAYVADDVTAGALAANGANCVAGSAPLGVDASGAAEGCYDVQTGTEASSHASSASAHHVATVQSVETVASIDAHPPMFYWTIAGSGLTTTTYPLVKSQVAVTITDIHCITDTGTVVVELEEGTSTAFDGGVVVDSTITCDSNGAEDDGTLTNGTIDANDWIAARIGTEASSPTMVGITVYYTVD